MIRLRAVTKRFRPDSPPAVRELDLEAADGELLVLTGPSGCGKTTTLRLLAGLETADAGDIEIDGVRVNELPARRREVSLVFQGDALYQHLSVYENIAFGLRLRQAGTFRRTA